MDISKWTIEDFVLHRAFVDEVLNPTPESSRYWESLLENNPRKKQQAIQARAIVLRMYKTHERLVPQDKEELWGRVQHQILVGTNPSSVKDMRSKAYRSKKKGHRIGNMKVPQIYRVAAILCVALGFSYIVNLPRWEREPYFQAEPIAYVEHRLPAGMKSTFALPDGSKVVLNAGSSLRYIKDFDADKRVIYLEGEAYFEVQKDTLRPFVVLAGDLSTTAIGTSFNISAYSPDSVNVYLLSGSVVVADRENHEEPVFLEQGEAALRISSGLMKGTFEEEEVMAWTKGVIIFNRTPIMVAVKTLENWYGVTFEFQNSPPSNLTVSGKFDNEQLKNIIEGLSYSARFSFKMEDKNVKIRF
jgi:transmembrane sensor